MIQLIKKHFLYFTVLCFLFVDGCSCSEDPKPDPCAGKIATTAEFTLYEMGGKFKLKKAKLYTDTVVFSNSYGCNPDGDSIKVFPNTTSCRIYFDAKDTSATSYLWEVGDNIKNFTVSGFFLDFNSWATPAYIDVKLTISKIPNKLCHPLDDGKDTTIRRIFFRRLGALEPHPMEGTYKGYINGNPKDTITFDVKSRAGYVEYNGEDVLKKGYKSDNQRFCMYSILNISKLKSPTPYQKAFHFTRTEVDIYSSGFSTGDDFAEYDITKNELKYERTNLIQDEEFSIRIPNYTIYKITINGYKLKN